MLYEKKKEEVNEREVRFIIWSGTTQQQQQQQNTTEHKLLALLLRRPSVWDGESTLTDNSR